MTEDCEAKDEAIMQYHNTLTSIIHKLKEERKASEKELLKHMEAVMEDSSKEMPMTQRIPAIKKREFWAGRCDALSMVINMIRKEVT